MDKKTLRSVQLVQLEILKEFDRVCKKNNIPYILSSGTLLGAVRHKGFIPWDDDLDVDMTRENYEKFLKCIGDFDENYSVQNWHTDRQFALPFTKIRKNNTVFREMNSVGLKNNGIYIDVFPWDKTDGSRSEKYRFRRQILSYLILLHNEPAYVIPDQTAKLRLLLSVVSVPFRGEKGRARLIERYEKRATKYEHLDSDYKYFENTAATRIGDWQLEPSVFAETAPLAFEDGEFPCPVEYDKYLSMSYGDYMTPPPEGQRENRHSIVEISFDTTAKKDKAALYNGLVKLLRAAITEQPQTLPTGFSLSGLLPIAKQHQCESLFYYGALTCGISASDPAMQKLQEKTLQFYAINEKQTFELSKLYAAFDAASIDYLPLKGSILKPQYPHPDMRVMSDADILIRAEQFAAASKAVEALGYTFMYESNHELVYDKPQLRLELHKVLIPTYHSEISSYFAMGWDFAERVSEDSCRYAFSAETTYLHLFTHFVKHFRDGGIGLRHFADLWVWRRAYPDMNWATVTQALTQMHLLDFHKNLEQTLDVWFADGKENAQTQFITKYIISSGAYGTAAQRRIGTATANALGSHNAKQIYRKNMFALVFPKRSRLVNDYPILEKQAWLLPFVWIVRGTKAIFVKRSVPMQKKRLQEISSNDIEQFLTSMESVGLPKIEEKQ